MNSIADMLRVTDSIGGLVCDFIRENEGKEFHGTDLAQYVRDHGVFVAPASPTTILRQLRLAGVIKYELVSRPKSLYLSLGVAA